METHVLRLTLHRCPLTTIPTMTSLDFLYYGTSDATWLAIEPMIWNTISLSLSIITACLPSMKNVFDGFLSDTFTARIDVSYHLNTLNEKTSPEALIPNPKTNNSGPSSVTSREVVLNAEASTIISCHTSPGAAGTGVKAARRYSQSESVQSLIEDKMMFKELEIRHNISRGSTTFGCIEGSFDGKLEIGLIRVKQSDSHGSSNQ